VPARELPASNSTLSIDQRIRRSTAPRPMPLFVRGLRIFLSERGTIADNGRRNSSCFRFRDLEFFKGLLNRDHLLPSSQ
jgi:hypothetical protein